MPFNITFPGVETNYYQVPDILRGSSRCLSSELFDIWGKAHTKTREWKIEWTARPLERDFLALCPILDADRSAINPPKLEFRNETFESKEFTEEQLFEELFKHELHIRIKPKKKYSINLKIDQVKKGKPRSFDYEVL